MEIWSGEHFTRKRAECTSDCNDSNMGRVGNDGAQSAKCTCAAPETTRELKINKISNSD